MSVSNRDRTPLGKFTTVLTLAIVLLGSVYTALTIHERVSTTKAIVCAQAKRSSWNGSWFDADNSACGPYLSNINVFVTRDASVGVRVRGGIIWHRASLPLCLIADDKGVAWTNCTSKQAPQSVNPNGDVE